MLYEIALNELSKLDNRQRCIIKSRFLEDKTLEEIGIILKITRERVRQIQKIAMKNLSNQMQSRIKKC